MAARVWSKQTCAGEIGPLVPNGLSASTRNKGEAILFVEGPGKS